MVQVSEKVTFGLVLKFLKWMLRVDPRRSTLSLIVQLIMSLSSMINLWVFSHLVNQAVSVYEGSGSYNTLLLWIFIWATYTIVNITLFPFFSIIDERVRQELEDELIKQLQHKTNSLRLEVMERNDIFDLLNRAKSATEPGVLLNLTWGLFEILRTFITVVSVSIILAVWSPWLLITMILVTLPPSMSRWTEILIKYKLNKKQIPEQRMLNYLSGLLTSREAAKEIRTYQMYPWIIRWWTNKYWKTADEQFINERHQNVVRGFYYVLSFMGLALGVGWCAWFVVNGGVSTGQFASAFIAIQTIHQLTGTLFNQTGYTFECLLKIGDFFTFMKLESEEENSADNRITNIGDVQAENVSFQYPQSKLIAVKNVSFLIREGEKIALVGENGSGKTTLVKLLLGLYTPTTGTISYGKESLIDLDKHQIREKMSTVFQDFIRYAVSMRDNIGFGDYDRRNDMLAVESAATKGGAIEIVKGISTGYDTMLTKQFSGGIDLSGGQWQKIAISRSFMKNSELVVLDEPSASLDPQAEADVFSRFLEVAEGKTAILVSHRLGLARNCDRILVMHEGKLLEIGTHEELLTKKGIYAGMWAMQAGWYQE
ncbi:MULTISPECIES: ABC transporter ATP-binding protein [Paenibacillus]|uniref:ATP-binding cassette subfamily B protein n=1 Tax=Paenibacillus pabuli TaxID=1472 RepID=A0A855Y248_9BACL|nr:MULTISPECIES: ABC transporter ATP-binding protein [Paenibacillus]PWW44315.1 ATP-binding cassette subfamily B protein [Paenibacillus pabuli]PXW10343.1 ATP-binding cassette subfamily B protein [Paenibacillus taichungensis]